MQVMCWDHVRSLMAPRAFRWSPNTTGNASWRTWMRRCGQHDLLYVGIKYRVSLLLGWFSPSSFPWFSKTGEWKLFFNEAKTWRTRKTWLHPPSKHRPKSPPPGQTCGVAWRFFVVQKGSCRNEERDIFDSLSGLEVWIRWNFQKPPKNSNQQIL